MSKMNKCKQCDFKCHDYAFMAEHVARMHTTNTQPDNSDLGLVSETEYILLPVDTQQNGGDELDTILEVASIWGTDFESWPQAEKEHYLANFRHSPNYREAKAKLLERERAARLDQMNYVDQRLIGKNPGGDRVFYDKDACVAESKLKDQQRIISDAMKAELQLNPQAGEGGEV